MDDVAPACIKINFLIVP